MISSIANQNNTPVYQPHVEEKVQLLDPLAPGGIVDYESGKSFRMWAATISAGYKEENTPRVVRDGKIRLHEDMGDAPGIKAALAATEYKSLTITMLSNSVSECLKQLFTAYGATKIVGDETALTVLKFAGNEPSREVIKADDPRFAATLKQCKASTFVPFALADWDEQDRPSISYRDGFMPYRLRFGSRNSAIAFVEALQAIKRLTNGQLVGVPLDLSIAYKDVLTPLGKRAKVPVWNPVLKHPRGLTLGARQIQGILTAGIKDAAQMALPPRIEIDSQEVQDAVLLSEENIEADLETGEVVKKEMSAEDVRTITTGEIPKRRQEDFFKATQGTPFTTDENRPKLVQRMADAAGVVIQNPSLRELVEKATAQEWSICAEVMCKASAAYLGTEEVKAPRAVVGDDDPYKEAIEAELVEDAAPQTAATPSVKQPESAAPAELPKVKSYFGLDREPTVEEIQVATAYSREHLTEAEAGSLKKHAGGIHLAFVLLQAKKKGVTTFVDMMRLIDPEFTETPPAQERLIS